MTAMAMKGKHGTVALFSSLLVLIVGAVAWFQAHQHFLSTDVVRGGMSQETKTDFLSKGVDCQDIYEVQGYESLESICRMHGLGQHEFYSLNPGVGPDFKPGSILCVKGIWGVSDGAIKPITWFWPAVAVVAAVMGFTGARLMAGWNSMQQGPIKHAPSVGEGQV